MTDENTSPELLIAEPVLTLEQQRRVAALEVARGMLETTSLWNGRTLGKSVGDLTYLANWVLDGSPDDEVTGETSDGFHTFRELYRFRLLYNAALFNEWATVGAHDVHKSTLHHDGTMFPTADDGQEWFIVVAQLPGGQISNHYKMRHWDLFQIPVRANAEEYDGHTAADVTQRLEDLLRMT